jgi:hypothetical protein
MTDCQDISVSITDDTDVSLAIESNDSISVDIEGDTPINFDITGGHDPVAFTGLTDTPDSYSGQSGKVVSVKSTEDGLEFTTVTSGADGIKKDGTTITTANIPFAEGISVNQDEKVSLNSAGTSYIIFNSSTSKVELWVLGVKKIQWG